MNKEFLIINTNYVSRDLKTTQTKTSSDFNSFEETLKIEEKKLEEKSKFLNFSPWGFIQSFFDYPLLKFDFQTDFNIEKTCNNQTEYYDKSDVYQNNQNLDVQDKNNAQTIDNRKSFNMQGNFSQQAIFNKPLNEYIPVYGAVFITQAKFVELMKFNSSNIKNLDQIVEAITKGIRLLKSQGKTTLELVVKPKDLDEMLLNVSSKNGVVSIEIITSREAKELLESGISSLKDALEKANINLGSLEISLRKQNNKNFLNQIETASPVYYNNEKENNMFFGLENLFAILNRLNVFIKA